MISVVRASLVSCIMASCAGANTNLQFTARDQFAMISQALCARIATCGLTAQGCPNPQPPIDIDSREPDLTPNETFVCVTAIANMPCLDVMTGPPLSCKGASNGQD